MGQVGIAIGSSFAAGGFFAATGVLQQRAAASRPAGESFSPKLLWSLAHDRLWLLGLGTGMVSYGLQSLALAFGPLALVQPLVLSELLFAVPISVRLNRMALGAREWIGLFTIAGGLALAIASAAPQAGDPLPGMVSWAGAIGIVAFVSGFAVMLGRRIAGPLRASLFALSAACVMALQSAFLAATVALMKLGPAALFSAWQPYALIPITAMGVFLVMNAYQAGPLAASMPVIDAAEPSVAVVIGVVVFSEHIHTSAHDLLGAGIGLCSFLVGITLLDTSPVVHALQTRQEHAEQDR